MGMKRCPFCAEKIQSKAVKCRHCGSNLLNQGNDGTLLAVEDSRLGKRRNRRRLGFLLILMVLLMALFSSVIPETAEQTTTEQRQPTPATTSEQPGTASQPTAVPELPTYAIISDETFSHFKRTLEIRLDGEISEKDLGSLALKLKGLDSHRYDRTFIDYYLPGMKIGAGAWATTHFNPDLEVRILGSTRAKEEDTSPEMIKARSELMLREHKQKVRELPFSLKEQKQIFTELVIAGDRADNETAQATEPAKSLQPGQVVRLEGEVPLMSEVKPKDPLAALRNMVKLPQGTEFVVVSVDKVSYPSPWYRVRVADGVFNNREGWINSIALIDNIPALSHDELIDLGIKLAEEYKGAVCRKHGMTPEQADTISLRGTIENWPLPPMP